MCIIALHVMAKGLKTRQTSISQTGRNDPTPQNDRMPPRGGYEKWGEPLRYLGPMIATKKDGLWGICMG
jgi:hypothetical protein